MSPTAEVKLYFDSKSPFAYLASGPAFEIAGEPFWGHDRLPLLEARLADAGLAR